jgi:MFS family permease
MRAIERSLRILSIESVITKGIFAMPILTTFFQYNIGMSLGQIALSQSLFIIALMLTNVPTGWIADRFSRKACNIAGDLICAIGFLGYSQATSFSDVVPYEIVLGVGLAFSDGADNALFKAYANILQISFEKHIARITSWRFVMEILAVLVGGYIGATHPHAAIGLSAIPFFVGAMLCLFIREAGERRITEVHPVRDMIDIGTHALHGNKQLANRISAFVVGRESTHHLIWLLTPLLLFAGVPAEIVGAAWAVNLASAWCGSMVASRYSVHMQDWRIIAVGASVYAVAGITLSLSVTIATIGFYAGFGFARGWFAATLMPMVQRHSAADMQSTVMSVAGSAAQLLYAPVGWILGEVADVSLQYSLIATMVIFLPAFAWIISQTIRSERR